VAGYQGARVFGECAQVVVTCRYFSFVHIRYFLLGLDWLIVFDNDEFAWLIVGKTHLRNIFATKKMTMAPKSPPPPRRYIKE